MDLKRGISRVGEMPALQRWSSLAGNMPVVQQTHLAGVHCNSFARSGKYSDETDRAQRS